MNALVKKLPLAFRDRYRKAWYVGLLEVSTVLAKAKRQFWRPALPQVPQVNLHLGCGRVNHPQFINIDGLPAPHIHYIRSLTNLSGFAENSVDLIYACHCLEHFSHHQTPEILQKWFKLLKQGGTLRLSVPDFDLVLEIYQSANRDIESIQGFVMGGQDYKFNFHQVLFNRVSLERLLLTTGFTKVQPWQPGSCEMTTFDDYSNFEIRVNAKSYPVSLNLEAIK
jgi:SAM-dependent methyltransferase